MDIDIVSDHLLLHFLSGCLVEAHPMINQSIESTEIWACLIINFIQNKKIKLKIMFAISKQTNVY